MQGQTIERAIEELANQFASRATLQLWKLARSVCVCVCVCRAIELRPEVIVVLVRLTEMS